MHSCLLRPFLNEVDENSQSTLVVLLKQTWIQITDDVQHEKRYANFGSTIPPSCRHPYGQHYECNPMRDFGCCDVSTNLFEQRQVSILGEAYLGVKVSQWSGKQELSKPQNSEPFVGFRIRKQIPRAKPFVNIQSTQNCITEPTKQERNKESRNRVVKNTHFQNPG